MQLSGGKAMATHSTRLKSRGWSVGSSAYSPLRRDGTRHPHIYGCFTIVRLQKGNVRLTCGNPCDSPKKRRLKRDDVEDKVVLDAGEFPSDEQNARPAVNSLQ